MRTCLCLSPCRGAHLPLTDISRNAIRKQTLRAVFGCEKFRAKTDPLERSLPHSLTTVVTPGWPYTHISVPGAFLNLPGAEKRCLDRVCSCDWTLGQLIPTVGRLIVDSTNVTMGRSTQALGILASADEKSFTFCEEISIENKPISRESISHNQTLWAEKYP